MNAKKQRDKNRRRALQLADEAWQEAEEGRLHLALKIIRRAVDLNPANPVLLHDMGTFLVQAQHDQEAAESFQAAIVAAPDFAEAYASFAAIRARQGSPEQAAALQREAVRRSPDSERFQSELAAYEALAAGRESANCELQNANGKLPADFPSEAVLLRTDAIDWSAVEDSLSRTGAALIPKVLSAEQCKSLRVMFDEDRLFSKTVTMNKPHFGQGVYRYFAAPIPPLIDAIRHEIYPHAAVIANRWQQLLNDDQRFPLAWPEFRRCCASAGQTTPSPLLLRYEAGGFNALHQDLRGEVFFPLQLVIVLSERNQAALPDSFTGGEFLVCDQPERKPADRREIPAGLGDAVLFATHSRPVRVGDVYGLRIVKHGLAKVSAGTRYAVGIPFHDFT